MNTNKDEMKLLLYSKGMKRENRENQWRKRERERER
jgi:hypothetical protein